MRPLIGEGHHRLDARAKVTGEARYSAEVDVPGLVHAALVLSTVASGRVRAIDASAAGDLPGFVGILRPEDGALLNASTVHHAGQPVALVLAESSRRAREAASLVRVAYEEPLPAPRLTGFPPADVLADPLRDRRPNDPLRDRRPNDPLRDRRPNDGVDPPFPPADVLGEPPDSRRGDVPAGLARGAAVVDETYSTPTHAHSPLERNAVVAAWDGDRVTVHTSTSGIFAAREASARAMGIPLAHVRVLMRYQGGGFGCKGSAWWPALVLAVAAARTVERPVRLELTRDDMFTVVGSRAATVQRVKLAATRDGRLTAIDHEATQETSTFAEYSDSTCFPSRIVYPCPNVATRHRLVRVNAPQPVAMRAPGEGPGSFALESALDELAHELGMDPVELRLRNVAARDEHHDRDWSSNGLAACLTVGARAFGWEDRTSARRGGPWSVGWGMASAYYPVFQAPAAARIRMERDGTVVLQCGNQDIGTGSSTVMAQVVARELDIQPSDVRLEYGDTDLPETPMAAGSMSSASVIPAVERAARALRAKLPGPAEVEAHARPPEALERTRHAFGACFAEVHVDRELGIVRVARITAAYAAGRILNAKLARSQYAGGIVFGIGMALHERVERDPNLGLIVNHNLSDYLIPVHADMPDIDVLLVEEDDDVKGIGMIGTVGVAAAIANAVFHATGKRIRRLPILPEAVMS
jgi:xanthine dehydrogenase YagR molybdenum-binding subunit